jgi:hypothetical protein
MELDYMNLIVDLLGTTRSLPGKAAPTETALDQAVRHVQRGREILHQQKCLIASLRAHGAYNAVATAQEILQQFERSQARFEADLAELQGKSISG